MNVKEFLEKYGERMKIRNASTLYHYIYAYEDELVQKDIVEFSENFTKRFINILKEEELVKFLEELREQKLQKKKESYLRRKNKNQIIAEKKRT